MKDCYSFEELGKGAVVAWYDGCGLVLRVIGKPKTPCFSTSLYCEIIGSGNINYRPIGFKSQWSLSRKHKVIKYGTFGISKYQI